MTTENKIKAFTALVGLAGLLFGLLQFLQVQSIQAARPYLEKKLEWCEEAVKTTAKIANANPPQPADITAFWQMYWGVMGLIENSAVTTAMINFGKQLGTVQPMEAGSKEVASDNQGLKSASLDLAHACRAELSQEWSSSWSRR